MHSELDTVLALCREPIIAVSGSKITGFSPAARELFESITTGQSIYCYVPEHILKIAEGGPSSACVDTPCGSCTVIVSGGDDMTYLRFETPEKNIRPNFLSDMFLSSLLSSLFNTGLAINLLSTDMAENEKSQKYFSILNHSYYSMRRLIENLHSASQLSDGTMKLNRSAVNLVEVCSALALSLRTLLKSREVQLQFSTELYDLYVNADIEKLEQVLLNLITNSYQHTPAGGKITLGLEKRDNRAIITVRDNGSGIAPDVLQNVFSRYEERLSKKYLSGDLKPGLGLAICRGIVGLHDGTMVVNSAKNEGTAVYISLPLDSNGDSFVFNDVSAPRNTSSMQLLLTQLCDILDSSFYLSAYLD